MSNNYRGQTLKKLYLRSFSKYYSSSILQDISTFIQTSKKDYKNISNDEWESFSKSKNIPGYILKTWYKSIYFPRLRKSKIKFGGLSIPSIDSINKIKKDLKLRCIGQWNVKSKRYIEDYSYNYIYNKLKYDDYVIIGDCITSYHNKLKMIGKQIPITTGLIYLFYFF